jgi:hypothetical protein
MSEEAPRGRAASKETWPPPSPISPEARIAAYATIGSVLIAATVWAVQAWRVSFCLHHCKVNPAIGGVVALLTTAAAIVAAMFLRSMPRRPVDPAGDGGWLYGLAAIFVIGVFVAVATGIPRLTCPVGSHLAYSGYCSGPHDAHLDPRNWELLKQMIYLGALVIGLTVIRRRRLVRVTAPVASLVWLGGTGYLLLRALVWRA